MLNLKFEEEIIALEKKIFDLKSSTQSKPKEIETLEKELNKKITDVYSKLTPWQKVEVARHPERPHAIDYINSFVNNFVELSGDRLFGEDAAILGGIGDIDGTPVIIVSEEKGKTIDEKLKHNFGSVKPEGYRKAIRLFKLADKYQIPIVTLIDTAGAYPAAESEERGIHEAIARSMSALFNVKVPVISVVIGEGGSGGAIAIAVADKILMLENSFYSTISPEGLAAILWKSNEYKEKAAEIMKPTAKDLLELGIIDEIIDEGLGGAHRNKKLVIKNVKKAILENIKTLLKMSPAEIKNHRSEKFEKMTAPQKS
jgi:acetyl-CoA carboxylase carboxyl transferase subunit alpha